MFWKREKANEGELPLPGPKAMPPLVGRHMVLEEKKDPNWVWNLKGVVHPTEEKKVFYCRVFSEAQAVQAGVKVKNWSSLDDHSALILWEGSFNTETGAVRREKFAKPSSSSN
jgi:hypothetical protein